MFSDASCHVNGQRYEGGETWIDQDDPCLECTCLVSIQPKIPTALSL